MDMKPPEHWDGHHDYVANEEIAATAHENVALKEAKYYGDLSLFRASATEKLVEHNALNEHGGWAIFEQEIHGETMAMSTGPIIRQTLLLVEASIAQISDNDYGPSEVRIITNELIGADDNGQWYAEDFYLNRNDESRYSVGAIDPQSQTISEASAPIFDLDNRGRLIMLGRSFSAAPSLGLATENGGERIRPFGCNDLLFHRIHALEVGRTLLEEVSDMTPIYVE